MRKGTENFITSLVTWVVTFLVFYAMFLWFFGIEKDLATVASVIIASVETRFAGLERLLNE